MLGYQWFGFNRKHTHVSAMRSHCGVSMFIKDTVMAEYNVTVIICVKFVNKVSEK